MTERQDRQLQDNGPPIAQGEPFFTNGRPKTVRPMLLDT